MSSHNPVLHKPVLGLFMGQMLPTLLSLLAASSTTIVDGIFVGKYMGSLGLAALNLLNPALNVLFGLALMLAIGAAVRAGSHMGAGRYRDASAFFTVTLLTVLGGSLVLVLLGEWFSTPLFLLLGGRAEVLPLMADYFGVILPFFLFKAQIIVLYFFLRLDGNPGLVASSFLWGAVLKVLLSFVFVSHLGWGLQGAAWSTGLSQVFACLLLLQYFRKPARKLTLVNPAGLWLQTWRCAFNGLSEFVNEASVSVVAFVLHWLVILRLGVESVASIAVYNYLMQISLMLYFAIAHASQTMISQNLGAGLELRVREFLLLALGFVLCAGLACTLGVLLLTEPVVALFLDSGSLQARTLAAELLHLLWPVFTLAGLNVAITAYFTAMHCPVQSTVLAFSRSLALPASLLLLLYWWLPGMAFLHGLAVAEALTFLVALVLLLRYSPQRLMRQGRVSD